MRTYALALTCFLFACYSPDLSHVRYSCDERNPFCPEGMACVGGCCGGCGSTMQPESGQDGGVDLASGPDLSVPPSGCRDNNGKQLDAKTWACPGAFPAGQIINRCAPGWSLCLKNTVPSKVSDVLVGFFASAVRATQKGSAPGPDMVCDWAGTPTTNNYFLVGLGNDGRPGDKTPQVLCAQFPRIYDLANDYQPQYWNVKLSAPNASDADFTSVANPYSDDGVLCCAP